MKEQTPSIKILVAEDDPLVAEIIANILRFIGYSNIMMARTGIAAVEMTVANRPDVILMDIEMPELDGLEACRWIQERCPTPVVVLSAHESPDLIKRASAAGAGAYVMKPAGEAEVDRAIAIARARHSDLMRYRKLSEELEKALAEIKTLRGILPMCMYCKKIRSGEGFWYRVEEYLRSHTEAVVSHGLCEDCQKLHYPDYC